jgi:methylamine--corrinoid protein Co-methyltransferase
MIGHINQMFDGKKRTESEHDSLIYETSLDLVESYGILYDPDELIPNMDMADRIFDAAIDLIDEVGVLCIDTNRIIEINKKEIKRLLKNPCSEFTVGEGAESTHVSFRNILDEKVPFIIGGPAGVAISDEFFTPAHCSYAKINVASAITPGSLQSLATKHYFKENPQNIADAQHTIALVKESCRLQGRPGICCLTPTTIEDIRSAISIANPIFMGKGDLQEIFPKSPLKTELDKLSRVVHYMGTGCYYVSTSYILLGSLTVSIPEQFAIQATAEMIISRVLYRASMVYLHSSSLKGSVSTSPEALWASLISSVAITRNTRILHGVTINNLSGPCTESMMYETALQTIGHTVCGADSLCGPIPNKGSALNHVSGFETLFMANIAEFATSLSLSDANYLCKELYTQKLANKKPEFGKAFDECYDINEIKPTDEYHEVYDKAYNQIYSIMESVIR